MSVSPDSRPVEASNTATAVISRKEFWTGTILIVILAGIFIYNVHRNFILPDDAFISFRYAENLVEGEGLVWNSGERVEGYTNFLWVLLMAGAMWLGVEPEVTSVALNLLAGSAILVAIYFLSARFYGSRSPLNWVAPLLLATSSSFTAWCSGGLATMFFTCAVFLAVVAFLREREQRQKWPLMSSLLFSVASLTRPEGPLFFAIAGVYFIIDLVRRKRTVKAALVWGAPYMVIVGSHFLWRFSYYGFLFPNTFYAKVPGAMWAQGLRYYSAFFETYHAQWFLPLALLSVVWRPRFVNALFGTIVLAYGTYVAAVGGDYLEFRFLVILLPYLYWLTVDGISRLAYAPNGEPRPAVAKVVAVVCAMALVLTTATGSVKGESLADLLRLGTASLDFIRADTERRTVQGRFLAELIDEGLLPYDTVICVGAAGIVPYYSGLPTVDRLGLNDVEIAHMPSKDWGLAGHTRDATPEYLRKRGVVIMVDSVLDWMHDQPTYDRENDPYNQAMPEWQRQLPLRVVKAKDKYLFFVSMVPEVRFQEVFKKLEIVE